MKGEEGMGGGDGRRGWEEGMGGGGGGTHLSIKRKRFLVQVGDIIISPKITPASNSI